MAFHKFSLLPAVAACCIHSIALATPPCPPVDIGAMARAASSGSMSIGSNGSALSYASSAQSAHASMATTTSLLPTSSGRAASITGETATQSAGLAYNSSTGSGNGWASAGGSTNAAAGGSVAIPSLRASDGSGATRTQSNFAIIAARNQGSTVRGNTASGFETVVGAERGGLTVHAATTGYVTGTNVSAALAGMNAAGLASIQASGYFNGTGQSGTVPRP